MKVAVGSVILTFAMTTLAGCSGGGDPDVDFTGFSDMPETGTTKLEGTTRSSNIVTTGLNTYTMSSPSGPNEANATVKTQNSNWVAVGIDAAGARASFGHGEGVTLDAMRTDIEALTKDGINDLFIVDGPSEGFKYQTYGMWITGLDTGSANVGVGSFGARTTTEGIPVASATYNGSSVGILRDFNGDLYLTESEVEVDTDFSTASISSTSTYISQVGTDAEFYADVIDFYGSGPVSGTGFTAQVEDRSGWGLTGTANGQFYGTNAQEVGGTFGLETPAGLTYIGSFGANQ